GTVGAEAHRAEGEGTRRLEKPLAQNAHPRPENQLRQRGRVGGRPPEAREKCRPGRCAAFETVLRPARTRCPAPLSTTRRLGSSQVMPRARAGGGSGTAEGGGDDVEGGGVAGERVGPAGAEPARAELPQRAVWGCGARARAGGRVALRVRVRDFAAPIAVDASRRSSLVVAQDVRVGEWARIPPRFREPRAERGGGGDGAESARAGFGDDGEGYRPGGVERDYL
ncbi:hypothetical protein DFH09DRAFT_1409033, partial [Mycena vulgaris]